MAPCGAIWWVIARLKPDSGAVCLAAYPLRAKPGRSCPAWQVLVYTIIVHVCMLVERSVLTVINEDYYYYQLTALFFIKPAVEANVETNASLIQFNHRQLKAP